MASRNGAVLKYWELPWRRVAAATAPVCLFVTLGCGLVTTACGTRTPPAATDATLKVGARGTDEAPGVLRSFLFAEGLLAIDANGRPNARLATDWTWEKEGRALRVHLRPNVRFHDDTAVTASSVVEILRQQIPKSDTRGFEAVLSVEAPDEQTILFHLSRPDGFFLNALAGLSIVDDRKPNIGTGPFRLVPNTTHLEAVRNTSVYRVLPGVQPIQHIVVVPYPTPRAAWVGLMRTDVNMALEVNRESVEFLEGATRFEKYLVGPAVLHSARLQPSQPDPRACRGSTRDCRRDQPR